MKISYTHIKIGKFFVKKKIGFKLGFSRFERRSDKLSINNEYISTFHLKHSLLELMLLLLLFYHLLIYHLAIFKINSLSNKRIG